jgi:hypothetical protein
MLKLEIQEKKIFTWFFNAKTLSTGSLARLKDLGKEPSLVP